MENLDRWKMAYWSQGKGDIALTDERAIDGRHSLRLRSHTRGEKPSPDGGVFGATNAVRSFDGEDWTAYNRLSFWVYPDLPGFDSISLVARVDNRGPGWAATPTTFSSRTASGTTSSGKSPTWHATTSPPSLSPTR